MDLPTVKGARVTCRSKEPSETALQRLETIKRFLDWSASLGVLSRDSVQFVIDDNGHVSCVATHFIPAGKHLLHVPFKMDLTFTSLRSEIHPDKTWSGWADLKFKIKAFEDSFEWNPYTYEQKDYFSKNLPLLICLVGILSKIERSPVLSQHSEIVQAFAHYWNALPREAGNIFTSWTEQDLACLEGSSFVNCLPDAKRFGEQIYEKVFVPFTSTYPQLFFVDNAPLSMNRFFQINATILTRSFLSTSKKNGLALYPIIDLVNGKPNELHNTSLENCAIQSTVNGEFYKYHVLETLCDIYAGDEIFIEYAQVGNGDYLLTYNHIPFDPDVIMNNQKTDIFLDLSEFLETELLRMHADSPPLRGLKRQHVYGFFNLPKVIPMSMEDLLSSEYSCMPSIRQVLIFLQFNEQDAHAAINTSRIKSQLTPQQLYHLFHMFLKLIEVSVDKVNLSLFRSIVTGVLPAEILTNSLSLTSSSSSSSSATGTAPGGDSSSAVTIAAKPVPLTPNMRSAIYLQMSERLVIEVMITRFVTLFPESFHEVGYTILRQHLVSNEIHALLAELCHPLDQQRQNQCMICGSCQNVSKCSRCRQAFYCSANCQKEHWSYHKKVCKPAASTGAGSGNSHSAAGMNRLGAAGASAPSSPQPSSTSAPSSQSASVSSTSKLATIPATGATMTAAGSSLGSTARKKPT